MKTLQLRTAGTLMEDKKHITNTKESDIERVYLYRHLNHGFKSKSLVHI